MPLLIRGPGIARGAEVDGAGRQRRLAPTILELAGASMAHRGRAADRRRLAGRRRFRPASVPTRAREVLIEGRDDARGGRDTASRSSPTSGCGRSATPTSSTAAPAPTRARPQGDRAIGAGRTTERRALRPRRDRYELRATGPAIPLRGGARGARRAKQLDANSGVAIGADSSSAEDPGSRRAGSTSGWSGSSSVAAARPIRGDASTSMQRCATWSSRRAPTCTSRCRRRRWPASTASCARSTGAEPLTAEDTEAALEHILDDPPAARGVRRREGEADFSYAIAGVSRFRVNAFRQRGNVSIACRAIPFQVRTIDDLGLPRGDPHARRGAARDRPAHRAPPARASRRRWRR